MPRESAGLLMYRVREGALEVLLVHPGGPYWRNKDAGAWTIPKGHVEPGEETLATARREFEEETGLRPSEPFLPLASVRQKAGKVVHAWAFEGDCDPGECRSNTYRVEWPPRSGRWGTYPEVDRAAFFGVEEAKRRINAAQAALVDDLQAKLSASGRV